MKTMKVEDDINEVEILRNDLTNYFEKYLIYIEEKSNNSINNLKKHKRTKNKQINKMEIINLNKKIIESLKITSPAIIKNIIKIINYKGIVLQGNYYKKLVKIILEEEKNDDLLEKFVKYIIMHNTQVIQERNKMPETELCSVKEKLSYAIEDNKILLESLYTNIESNLEKIKKLKNSTIDKIIVDDFSNNLLTENRKTRKSFEIFSSISEVERLHKFIVSSEIILITEKHRKIFENLPDINEDTKLLFNNYAKRIELKIEKDNLEKIKKDEEQLKLFKEKNEKLLKLKNEEIIKKENEARNFLVENISVSEDDDLIYDDYSLESKNIYDSIISHNKVEYITSLLPNIENSNYFKIKNDLIKLIKEEKMIIDELLKENKEDKYLKKLTINLLVALKDLEIYFETEEYLEEHEEYHEAGLKNIFFAKRSNDIPYFLTDLNELTEIEKKQAIMSLETLKQDDEQFRKSAIKKLRMHNKTICEVKNGQTRLLYKPISGHNYLILGVYIKKRNLDHSLIDSASGRDYNTFKEFLYIKELLLNDSLTEEYKEEHIQYYKECLNILDYKQIRKRKK